MNRFALTIILLVAAALCNFSFTWPEADVKHTSLQEFPLQVGDWKSVAENVLDERTMAVLLVDDYLMRTYVNSKGQSIHLYIGYFKSQREGKQVHSPRQCLPGGGWNTEVLKEYELPLTGEKPGTIPVNYQLVGNGDTNQLFLWWYQERGRTYANEYLNKIFMIWDAVTSRRTDGALVRINMSIQTDTEKILATEVRFVNLIFPLLPRFVPE